MKSLFNKKYRSLNPYKAFPALMRNVLEVRTIFHLSKALDWNKEPILSGKNLYEFDYLEDLNDRRVRDAEVLFGACRNNNGHKLLEIGTAHGQTTSGMAQNAPDSTIYTINILPEEIDKGGQAVTFAPAKEDIGRVYRENGYKNVIQIYANTATWEPDIGTIKVGFIDGCHDSAFVINDTKKVLSICEPGSLVIWHDFNLSLASKYHWIASVCRAIEVLYEDGTLKGKILHLQDSWTGIYQVA